MLQQSKNRLDTFPELNRNNIMSLQFTVANDDDNTVRCHLFYGCNHHEKMRFFPEHLTSIVPRFFKRDKKLNYYDYIQKLYDDKYKHGFAVDLNDNNFNQAYKI
eukprot:173329_1